MNHDRFDALVDALLAGGLPDAERRDAEAHAAGCSPCGALLADARSFRAWASGALAPDAPPADLEDRIIARFRAAHAARPRRSWPRLARAFRVAGGLAAAAFLIVLGAAFTEAGTQAPLAAIWGAEAESSDFVSQVGSDFRDLSRLGFTGVSKRKPKGIAALDSDKTVDAVSDGVSLGGRPRRSVEAKGDSIDAGISALVTSPAKGKEDFYLEDVGVDLLDRTNSMRLGAISKVGEERAAEAPATVDPPPPPKPEPPAPDPVGTPGAAPEPVPFQEGRKLIRNGNLALEVEAYDAAYARIAAIVAEERGFVAGADTTRLANGKISAVVTVRIPPDRFEAALEKFRGLGTVKHQSVSSEDVTKAYLDLEARLGTKTTLLERLRKILQEAKGTVKELMEVEVQMGRTQEEIESIKGELKYYDNLVGMSTVKLEIAEKDLGQPFEFVQSLQSTIGITADDVDAAYAAAQKAVADAGGQVVDSKMTRQNDGSARGTIRAKVDAEKFPALREELRKLGHVDQDTVNRQKTARGGQEGPPRADAPVRKEQAVISLTISTPALFVSRTGNLALQAAGVEGAYQAARKAVEAAGGKIVDGRLEGSVDRTTAVIQAQVEAAKFGAVVEALRALGKVKSASTGHAVPPSPGVAPLVRERGEISLRIESPPVLIGEEQGILRTVRDTLAGSWAGILWSVEKLFVGLSLAGPWLALGLGGWFVWRRVRGKKAARTAA